MRDTGPGWTSRVAWNVTHGRYEEHVPKPIFGRDSALFLFLDPFGYSHAPMTLTRDLVQQPKSDTLIFLPLSFVNRFKERDGQQKAMDRFFGTPAWRDVADGRNRPSALLELFQQQLRSAGLRWVLPFQLKPDTSNEYWIVGGSGHLRGFASIKEAYWAVDKVNGRGFTASKPAPAGQTTLPFAEPELAEANTQPLLDELKARFRDKQFTVDEAIVLTEESRFLDSHLKEKTLAKAEKAGILDVKRPPGVRRFKEGKGTTLRFV
jgi:hypothetical protein